MNWTLAGAGFDLLRQGPSQHTYISSIFEWPRFCDPVAAAYAVHQLSVQVFGTTSWLFVGEGSSFSVSSSHLQESVKMSRKLGVLNVLLRWTSIMHEHGTKSHQDCLEVSLKNKPRNAKNITSMC